jgi:hypothetical protein
MSDAAYGALHIVAGQHTGCLLCIRHIAFRSSLSGPV